MYYAEIDLQTRICFAVTETSGQIIAPQMIELQSLDTSLLGKVHNEATGEFEVLVLPPSIPQILSMRQARLALLDAGLLNSVQTAINGLPSPQKERAQIEWDYSNEVQRHNGFVATLGPALGLSEAQIDALFVAGAVL